MKLHILHLEDDPKDAELVKEKIESSGLDCEITLVDTKENFTRMLEEKQFDVIISDFSLPSYDGKNALMLSQQKCPDVPFIFVSGTIGEDAAIESLLTGATDYVLKHKPSRLVPAIRRALREAEEHKARQKAEEELRESESFLRTMFESVPECIKIISAEGTILQMNQSGLTMVEADSSEQVLGKSVYEMIVPEHRDAFCSLVKNVHKGTKGILEYEMIGLKGTRRILETHAVPLYTTAKEIIGMLSVTRDITERKKLEVQFLRSQRMESLGALASGVAHDLNNILSPITLASQLLKKSIKGEYEDRLLNSIMISSQRGADIVKQVLSFARGVEGGKVLLQIKYIISDIEKIIRETFPRNIILKTDISSDLWLINANSTQIHQVLMNICVNARDAMVNGGTLSIKAENVVLDEHFVHSYKGSAPGPSIFISISDTGTGIPKEHLHKVFDPFFTTKDIGEGTGLGLSTVMGIVQSHGGLVTVSSELKKGTVFKLYLPAVPGEAILDEQLEEKEVPSGNNETILVVDDEEALREMVKAALESYGYNVISAGDGAEAVARFVEHKRSIAAVVTDMMMPYMDGEAMVRALQKIEPKVKIIATSGLASGKNPNEAGLKVQAYMQKPYTTQNLLKTLRGVLDTK